MKNALFFLVSLLFIPLSKGQETCSDIPCDSSCESDLGCSYSGATNVKVYFHVYRDNDGNGGQPPSRLNQCITTLNDAFSDSGISFHFNRCETRYVDDTRLWKYVGKPYCDIFFTSHAHDDGLDIHLLSDDISYTGRACHIPGAELLMGGKRAQVPAALSSGMAHEVGHCFGLFHTHHNQFPDYFADCQGNQTWVLDPDSGDWVSDTPPDPTGISPQCNWGFWSQDCGIFELCDGIDNNTNGLIDEDHNYGQLANCSQVPSSFSRPCFDISVPPLVDNIMSYYGESCRNSFTPCQISRMEYFADQLGVDGSNSAEVCCGDYTLDDGSTVDDLVALLQLNSPSELSNVKAEVLVLGTFTIDQSIDLRGPIDFYMGQGATIRVTNGARFSKIGGFITNCSEPWNSIRVESDSDIYLYDVELSGGSTAVTILGSTGTIQSCLIYGFQFGVYMDSSSDVLIDFSEINCSFSGISAYRNSSFTAVRNKLGQSEESVYSIYVHSSQADIVENTIFTDYTGIYTVGATDVKVYHNTVETRGNDNGILIYNSDAEVTDNTVSMGNSAVGIYSSSNHSSNTYRNNYIQGSGRSGIRMDASSEQNLIANRILGNSARGINLSSSDGNTIECNEIEADDFGLTLYSFSDLQHEIKTNKFIDAGMDFYTASNFGVHSNLGNIEWEDAESLADPDFGRFEVSSVDPVDGWVPSNDDWSPQGLFEEAGTDDEICTEPIVGPRPYNPDWVCIYVDSLLAKRNTNFNQSWINRFHLIRRHLINIPWHEWPPCIREGCMLVEDCCLEKLAEAQAKIQSTLQQNSEESNVLNRSDKNSSEATREINYQNRDVWKVQARSRLIFTVNEVQDDLDEIDCVDPLITTWTETYRIVIKDLIGEVSEADINYLQEVASLCPTDYGDPVHWAQGILVGKIPHYNISIKDCDQQLDNRGRESSRGTSSEIKIYPNPANQLINIESEDWEYAILSLINTTGKTIKKVRLDSYTTQLNVREVPSGVYFIQVDQPNGKVIIDKIIINH